MGVLGNLDQYTKFQAATAITEAAENPERHRGRRRRCGHRRRARRAAAPRRSAPTSVPTRTPAPAAAAAAAAASPPPLPGATQWYLGIDGQQVGPLSPAEVAARVVAGTATPETLAWRTGLAGWTAISDIPELQPPAPAGPPPLPGS